DCRRYSWDVSLLSALSDYELRDNDALIFHYYLNSDLTNDVSPSPYEYPGKPDIMEIDKMLSKPFQIGATFRNNELRDLIDLDLMDITKDIKAWVTEYNLRDKKFAVHGSWAHGLFTAA